VSVSTDSLDTVIKNTSGVRKSFPFLPPHGVTLDPDQEYRIPGDLLGAIASKRGCYAVGLQEAMQDGALSVKASAPPIFDLGEDTEEDERGQELTFDLVGSGLLIPSRVVGLWWPGQDVRLGRFAAGTATATSLRNYIPGQPNAATGTYNYTGASPINWTLTAPDVEDDVFGEGEAGLLLQGTAGTTSKGLILFPEGYDEDLIDGTDWLGVSFLFKTTILAGENGLASSGVHLHGNLYNGAILSRTGGSVAQAPALQAINTTTGSGVSPVSSDPGAYTFPHDADGIFLATFLYNGSTAILRLNKGEDVVTYSGFGGWTGAAAASVARAARAAVFSTIDATTAKNHRFYLGPMAIFRATTDAGELLEVEELLHEMAGEPTLRALS
jgi:hypothetical protein